MANTTSSPSHGARPESWQSVAVSRAGIPITVIGGYLGAGKTTLLNRLLAEPHGRRLGVIVNDFGSIGIDAELLAAAAPDGVVNLPNGCVCCTLGQDLLEALTALRHADPPPDHIVIEASGVADPAVAAAWGTSTGFAPGGVVVLAAADSVRRQAQDAYVGGEVVRQLAGADLIVVTKEDLCTHDDATRVDSWIGERTGAPTLRIDPAHAVPTDVILGIDPGSAKVPTGTPHDVEDRYVRWSLRLDRPVDPTALDAFLADLPQGLLRMKGLVVTTARGRPVVVDVVGPSVRTSTAASERSSSELVAIGVRGVLDIDELERRTTMLTQRTDAEVHDVVR